MFPPFKPCPCGSKRSFSLCCGPILAGEAALTPEALMRSRYTAFALGEEAHLLRTWHPSTRPNAVSTAGVRWLGLVVEKAVGDRVKFRAKFKENDETHTMREHSRFVQEDGQWFYLDGE